MKKKIIFITLILLIIALIPMQTYCADPDSNIDLIIDGLKDVKKGDTSPNSITGGINTIFSLIRYVGTGLSVITVMVLGIRYMSSSIEEKAEIKKKTVPIVIGCVLLFATVNIMGIIIDIVNSI